jgi:hypothetical protein
MNIRVATKTDLAAMDRWSNLKTEPAYLNLVIPGIVGLSVVFTTSNEFAMINNLVTNRLVSRPVRQKAIDTIVAYTIKMIENANIKHIIAFSSNESTILRSARFGFSVQNEVLIKRSF